MSVRLSVTIDDAFLFAIHNKTYAPIAMETFSVVLYIQEMAVFQNDRHFKTGQRIYIIYFNSTFVFVISACIPNFTLFKKPLNRNRLETK